MAVGGAKKGGPSPAAGGVVILPLAVHHPIERNLAPGVLMLLLVAMLAIDTAAIRRGREPPVPMAVLLVPAVAGLAIGLPNHGPVWGVVDLAGADHRAVGDRPVDPACQCRAAQCEG
ncbi:MAG TPA: hypothetical protein VFK84_15360 [Burkholderiales bacterium]|nr:hypothetical protein [Burkholderiales bacterium]